MGMLAELGIVKSAASHTAAIFEKIVPDFLRLAARTPSEYMRSCWSAYQRGFPDQGVSTNGKFFELCIATTLIREKILPFYMQAQIAFVPNVDYDFILYSSDRGPICISGKTTLRERYKQADLEALALKHVHRRAKCYLVNNSKEESDGLRQKIRQGELIGLDDSVFALDSQFDEFLAELRKYCLVEAPEVKVVVSNTLISATSA